MSALQDKGSRHHGVRAEACLDRHACQGGRLSWSARPGSSGMALTRSARSGGCRVSREVGLPAALPYERRQLPTRVDGPCRARPWEFVGLPPLRVRPVRGPGFIPLSNKSSIREDYLLKLGWQYKSTWGKKRRTISAWQRRITLIQLHVLLHKSKFYLESC